MTRLRHPEAPDRRAGTDSAPRRFDEKGQRGYRFNEQRSDQALLPGKIVPMGVVTAAGFEPAFPIRHALSEPRPTVRQCLVNFHRAGIRISRKGKALGQTSRTALAVALSRGSAFASSIPSV